MMRAAQSLAAAILLGLTAPAAAQKLDGPTPEQLLERPAATEIVRRWVDICVAHAGDRSAQELSARRMGLDWPYMLMTPNDAERGQTCALVSTVAAGDDTATLGLAIASALSRREGFEIGAEENYMRGFVTVNGLRYLILANIDRQQGEPLPTAVLSLSRNPRNDR